MMTNRNFIIGILVFYFLVGGYYVYIKKDMQIVSPQETTAPSRSNEYGLNPRDPFASFPFQKGRIFQLSSHLSPPKFLYSEGDYFYYIYILRETEGWVPIVRESTSTKESSGRSGEYTGVMFDIYYKFSPNKHRLAFVDIPDRLSGAKERLCVAQIYPKIIRCVGPDSSDETFINDFGDFGQPAMDGRWINDFIFEADVYKTIMQSNTPGEIGYKNPTEIIRTQRVTI